MAKIQQQEEISYEIKKAELVRGSEELRLTIAASKAVSYESLQRISGDLTEAVPGLSRVRFSFDYHEAACDRQDLLSFLPCMIASCEEADAFFTHSILRDKVQLDDGCVTFFAVGEKVSDMLNDKAGNLFSEMLHEAFGRSCQVRFANDEESYRVAVSEAGRAERTPAPVPAVKPGKPKAAKAAKAAPSDGRLLGRSFHDPAVPMKQAAEADGSLTVEGEIFHLETREIKNGKVIVKFLFSDGTNSMCAKSFVPGDKWQAISDRLQKGAYVRVRGSMEFDTFDNANVLMVRDVQAADRPVRIDALPEKRVELHCHTKMSDMDGLNEAADVVKRAIAWGQPAVAITDHGVVQSFPLAARAAAGKIKVIYGMEGYLFDDHDCMQKDGTIDYKKKKTNHVILLAKNKTGLMNLYKLVSISHIKYFYRRPRLPKSVLAKYREGLIIGSACEAGEVFRAITGGADEETIETLASFYDYLEVQPIVNNSFMINKGIVSTEEDLRDLNRRVVALGEKLGKPVVATTDAHYGQASDYIYRNILMAGKGFDVSGTAGQGLFMRTTQEMLDEFAYLGEDKAHEIVIENTNGIADQCETFEPVPDEKCPPKIEHADEILRDTCEKNAAAKYGDPLPAPIRERLDKELDSVISNGYAVMYVAAKMLVDKSMSDGYLVGSRGSVGSSFAAMMAGITEVNPLPPHYICPHCKHLVWGDEKEYDCGIDMPPMTCPECGTPMEQDGYAIPFETFLGFYGDKEPDIDLNFAGEYQARAHRYVGEIFGEENVYKAGTIGTIKDKTAYGYVMKYFEERGIPVNKFEAERLTQHCTGVKRTTGQHPGGIIIVPRDRSIYEFCPVQHPANDRTTDIVTTHFEYHSIDKNLLKLDILGHEIPSMIRHLQDMTGKDPLKVRLNDPKVMSIFTSIEGLDIKDPDYRYTHGTYGIPEFGTKFVRQMLDDTKPTKFADLVRISGFSHGTDVWLNNAQEYIRSGQATMKEAISTRDDIMNYLILKGVPKGEAFQIMEKVRKGKGVTEERIALMREHDVPDWYIESCLKIKYMFPRAHAVAYVLMSYRIAYYKVYYPAAFYAVYLTSKITDFNWDVVSHGAAACLERISAIEMKGRNATDKEADEVTVLEICYEMYARGYDFLPPDLEHSEAVNFTVREGKVQVPLCGLAGVGATAGKAIALEQRKKPFATVEELQTRTRANKTVIEAFRQAGLLDGMQETDQLSLF